MKKLVVAEKPSVARDIARVIGAKERGEGFLAGGDYIVTWAVGHLVSHVEPDEIDEKYKRWSMSYLPILPQTIPNKVLPQTRAQFEVIRKLMLDPEVASLICATDAGREGELIFRLIYTQAKCQKPFERLWISSMTDSAIKAGFRALAPSAKYDSLYLSAKCRSDADWIVGMNASRAFSIMYSARLSVGRVQTPTLALIVARDIEIAAFSARDYWELTADFSDYKGLWYNPAERATRSYDKEEIERVKSEITGKRGTVTESLREKKNAPPPFLYDLTALQRDANAKHGFSADKTLKIAQSLYENKKLITYPRTDSRRLSDDMKPKVAQVLRLLPVKYAPLAAPLLAAQLTQTRRIYDDSKVTDHHAIIPTGAKAAALTLEEEKIFDMIVRRLLAVHYPDYVYESAKITTRVGAHDFVTTGNTPVIEGWRALYRDEPEQTDTVPDLPVGSQRDVAGASVKKHKTKPPARHTDASLLGLMENAGQLVDDEELREKLKASGLGTPATRAAIIERLIQTGYVQREAKALTSTEKGKKFIQIAPEQIKSAATTGKWERALSDMARMDYVSAQVKAERFMAGIDRFAVFLVDAAKAADKRIYFEKENKKPK